MSASSPLSAPDNSTRDESPSKEPAAIPRRQSRWIYPVLLVGIGLFSWRGYSDRSYWKEVWEQKTFFPAYKVPNRTLETFDGAPSVKSPDETGAR